MFSAWQMELIAWCICLLYCAKNAPGKDSNTNFQIILHRVIQRGFTKKLSHYKNVIIFGTNFMSVIILRAEDGKKKSLLAPLGSSIKKDDDYKRANANCRGHSQSNLLLLNKAIKMSFHKILPKFPHTHTRYRNAIQCNISDDLMIEYLNY